MKLRSLLLVFIVCLLASCGSDDDNNDMGPTMGNITGAVFLFNDINIPQPRDGMLVSIVGTSHQATTNTEGVFMFEDIEFGDYQLQYEKAGFGTYISEEYEHGVAGETETIWPESPLLGQISTTTISSSRAVLDGSDFLISAQSDPAGTVTDPRYVTIFLSKNPEVSNTDNTAVIGVLKTEANPIEVRLTRTEIEILGFASDETVYIKVYGDALYPNAYDSFGSIIHPNANLAAGPTMDQVVQ